MFETEFCYFKIDHAKMEEMKFNKNFISKIASKIQQGLRIKVPKVSGKQWEDSWSAIFKEVVGDEFNIEDELFSGEEDI